MRQLRDGDDLWDRASAHLSTGDVLARIRDQQVSGLVSGGGGGGRSVMWCWNHERPVDVCLRHDLHCAGESIDINDPIGEAATTPDRAAQDRKRIEALVARHLRDADELVRILWAYKVRPPTDKERRVTEGGETGCWSCARLPSPHLDKEQRWEPVYREVDLGGERKPLCSWCWSWRRDTGDLPSTEDLERHHAGQRVRRPAEA
jgi:hypothetical protein